MLIFNDVSATVKLWREQFYIILREWKAMTCRYRFILMGANTIRERHQWFSLMEFNDSIRFLSPLYRLSSKLSLHHHPHCLEKNKPSLWAWLSSGIYQSLLFDNQLLIIQRISFFVCTKHASRVRNARTVKAEETVFFRLEAPGSHPEWLSTALCWCTIFSLSSSIPGHIWWYPFPFRVSPRDSLIYCLCGMPFFEGESVAF